MKIRNSKIFNTNIYHSILNKYVAVKGFKKGHIEHAGPEFPVFDQCRVFNSVENEQPFLHLSSDIL